MSLLWDNAALHYARFSVGLDLARGSQSSVGFLKFTLIQRQHNDICMVGVLNGLIDAMGPMRFHLGHR